jgi:biopolymer transport protein ExbD
MKKRTRESALPDITPLIDVVFLLLIFFMVTTVFKKDEFALLLNLPTVKEGESKTEKKVKNIILELSKSEIAYNNKKYTFETLPSELKSLQDKTTAIELRIDKKVEYDRVVKLLNMLKQFKLNNLNLITDK